MLSHAPTLSVHRSRLSTQIPFRNGPIRFLTLFLVSMVVFGNMYAFNNPQALQMVIMHDLAITQTQFNMLYTIIALPNLIFPLFVGLLIDVIGVRVALVTLTFGVLVSQFVVALGAVHNSYQTMLWARMVFGIAAQSLSVAQTCIVSYWFLGKQLAFSIGLATTLPELGNAVNSLVTPIIYQKTQSLGPPLFTSVGVCCVCFVCACAAAYIDKLADESDAQRNLKVVTDSQQNFSQIQQQGIKWKDLKQLKLVFWMIVTLCMLAMSQYVPFLDNANLLVQVRFCFSQISAGRNIMYTYLVTSLLGFPLGILVDRIGYKRYLIMTGMGVFLLAHLIIFLTPQCETSDVASWSSASWGLLLLGFGYCFYANCIVPSIPIIISKKITGSAFGIMLVFQNFAMAVCPLITGQIVQNSNTVEEGYKMASLFFVMMGVIGVGMSFSLFCIPESSKKLLDGTSSIKKIYTIELNPSFSDDEYIQQQRNTSMISEQTLNQRLIRTYDHIQFVQEREKVKPMIPAFQIQI